MNNSNMIELSEGHSTCHAENFSLTSKPINDLILIKIELEI